VAIPRAGLPALADDLQRGLRTPGALDWAPRARPLALEAGQNDCAGPAPASTPAPTIQSCMANQRFRAAAQRTAASAPWAASPNANQAARKPSTASSRSRPACPGAADPSTAGRAEDMGIRLRPRAPARGVRVALELRVAGVRELDRSPAAAHGEGNGHDVDRDHLAAELRENGDRPAPDHGSLCQSPGRGNAVFLRVQIPTAGRRRALRTADVLAAAPSPRCPLPVRQPTAGRRSASPERRRSRASGGSSPASA